MKKLHFLLLPVLLIGCGTAPGHSSDPPASVTSEGLEFAVGFYNDDGTSITARNTGEEAEELTVTITGPSGWNSGEPYEMPFSLEVGSVAIPVVYGSPALPGTYTARFQAGGRDWHAVTTLNATSNSLTSGPAGFTYAIEPPHVHVEWDPVPGAHDYEISLSGPGVSVRDTWALVRQPRHTFEIPDDSLFGSGEEYFISGTLMSDGFADFTSPADRRTFQAPSFRLE